MRKSLPSASYFASSSDATESVSRPGIAAVRRGDGVVERVVEVPACRVQPDDPRITPEPRLLAAGERPRPAQDRRPGLVERCAPRDVLEQLPVAERLTGGARQARRPCREAGDLVDETGGELGLEPGRDPAVELAAVEREPDEAEPRRPVVTEAWPRPR